MIMEAVALVVMASWFGPVPWTYVFTQDVMVPWEYGVLVWLVILEVCFYSGRNVPLGYLTSWGRWYCILDVVMALWLLNIQRLRVIALAPCM